MFLIKYILLYCSTTVTAVLPWTQTPSRGVVISVDTHPHDHRDVETILLRIYRGILGTTVNTIPKQVPSHILECSSYKHVISRSPCQCGERLQQIFVHIYISHTVVYFYPVFVSQMFYLYSILSSNEARLRYFFNLSTKIFYGPEKSQV